MGSSKDVQSNGRVAALLRIGRKPASRTGYGELSTTFPQACPLQLWTTGQRGLGPLAQTQREELLPAKLPSVITGENAPRSPRDLRGKVDQALATQMLEGGGGQTHGTRHALKFDNAPVTVERGEQGLLYPIQPSIPCRKPLACYRRLLGVGS